MCPRRGGKDRRCTNVIARYQTRTSERVGSGGRSRREIIDFLSLPFVSPGSPIFPGDEQVFGGNLAINLLSTNARANVRGKRNVGAFRSRKRNQSECFFIACTASSSRPGITRLSRGSCVCKEGEGRLLSSSLVPGFDRLAQVPFLFRARLCRPSRAKVPGQSCLDKHERFVCIVPRQRLTRFSNGTLLAYRRRVYPPPPPPRPRPR